VIMAPLESQARTIRSSRQPPPDARATRVVISIFGIVVGLAAIEHGVGEISQGSARPASLLIQSWPDTAAFTVLAGEPALTVLPTFLLSGILTCDRCLGTVCLVGVLFGRCFVQRCGGGLVLILLSLVLLLTGGGLGPPLIGLILGVAALRMHALPRYEVRRFLLPLARVWEWALVAGGGGIPGPVAWNSTVGPLRGSRQRHHGVRPRTLLLRCVDSVAGRCPNCRSTSSGTPRVGSHGHKVGRISTALRTCRNR
jgi:hypothetical protein